MDIQIDYKRKKDFKHALGQFNVWKSAQKQI